MTGKVTTQMPWFAAALIVFQITIQFAAAKWLWLGDLDLKAPLSASATASVGAAVVIVLAAVGGSGWLGRQSRRRGEPQWLLWLPLVPALLWLALKLAVTQVMFMSDYQGYPASAFVLMYVDRAVVALVWCSAAAALSLRAWGVMALAFHTHAASRYADALGRLADGSVGLYSWDAKPEAVAAVLNQISSVSLWGTFVAFFAAMGWEIWRRRST